MYAYTHICIKNNIKITICKQIISFTYTLKILLTHKSNNLIVLYKVLLTNCK